MLFLGLLLIVFQYPIRSLSSDQINALWIFIRIQVFFATQLWFILTFFSLILLGCGLWIYTCITSAVSISSIYFGSILQIFFISNNNSILHRSSRSVYCSFSSCGIGFPSSPYLFSLPFIQEILPLNYVCAVLPILTCLLFLFVLPLPGVPSLFLFHLIPCSILELDGSC